MHWPTNQPHCPSRPRTEIRRLSAAIRDSAGRLVVDGEPVLTAAETDDHFERVVDVDRAAMMAIEGRAA